MKHLVLLLVAVVTLDVVAVPAHAQPRRPDAGDKREQIKRRIRDLRAYALIDKLQLDPVMQQKVLPILDRYDDETARLVSRRVAAMQRLAAMNAQSPGEIDQAINEAIAVQRAFRDLEDHRFTELRRVLSPRQTAKLLVVLPEFERRIQNQLRKAALGATRRRDRAAAPPQSSEDDDDFDEPAPPRSGRSPSAPPAKVPPGRLSDPD